ncbi:hypothetical protein B0H10DRAFT_1712415, partial [Mycena sp. CBHHK59/15]
DREKDVDIEAHIKKWTLNHEQAHAFRIIASHSLEEKPQQLRMLLSGPGGTGKSRVIHALQDFFWMRGQDWKTIRPMCRTFWNVSDLMNVSRRVAVSGFREPHSALCISQCSQKSAKNRTRRDLTAMWEGVDYLFIDEISMVGC